MSEINELPNGWVCFSLGDITTKNTKKATPEQLPDARFVGMDCIEANSLRPHKYYSFKDFKSSGNCFENNQVLYGRMRPYLNKVFLASFEGVCSGEFIVLNCLEAFYPDYLQYILHGREFVRFANSKTSGDRPRITFEEIATFPIKLPPLPEQRRIVSKIEELFSSLDKGVQSLKTARQQLKIYRQAVLKWAFEGRLTESWRNMQSNLLGSTELLCQIKNEREKYCIQNRIKPKRMNLLNEEELADLPELSNGWSWVRIDALSENEKHSIKAGPFGSSLKKEFYVSEGYKVYGQEQVIAGDADFGNYFINEDKYKELFSCRVQPHDILISLVGTIGKVLVLPEGSLPGVINPRLVKISLNRKFYLPTFFKYYFESSFLKVLYKNKAHGATMDVLNLGLIQELPFPLCSIQEQRAIVSEIESRLSVCDKIEESITQSLLQAEALRQSILKRAFEGKLVPQDPADEPASVLLKRIREERGKNIVTPKVKKVKKSRQTEIAFETV